MIAGKSSKLELAKAHGIIPIEMDRNDYSVHEEKILKENPLGIDLIVDATGSTKVISESMKLLKKGGTLLQYAIVHSGEKVIMDPVLMFNNELTYTASFCQSHNFGRAVDVLASGVVDGDSLVTGEFALEDFYAGLDENVKDRNSVKVIIHPNSEK